MSGTDVQTLCCRRYRWLRLWSWSPVFAINMGIILVWTIAQFGFGTYFSIVRLIHNVNCAILLIILLTIVVTGRILYTCPPLQYTLTLLCAVQLLECLRHATSARLTMLLLPQLRRQILHCLQVLQCDLPNVEQK